MSSPGSITNAVPDPDKAVRLQRDVQRAAQENASARSLQQSQIGAGGLLINNGGSLTIAGGGSLNVGSGALNSAGSISAGTTVSAGTDITAGGTVQGAAVTSTGPVSAVDVNASGRVTSAAAFRSPGSYAYHVVTGYQAMWINNDGTIGVSASNRDSKKDLVPLTDVDPILTLQPYLGRYIWDDETAPLKQFLIAEDVHAAGFGPDVAPLDDSGAPLSINYSQLVPALIATVKELSARLDALEHPTV